ncbi:MAG TPA: regulatory protein RecX [Egibacteraceae bacterium]|nr:regulatory protein RecX [Egibacteraceae bacterium]
MAESGPFDKAVAEALSFVLRSTANRPQTEAELITKLERQELAGDVIDAALARARQVGAVDDVAFAAAWVEDRGRQRGYGQARLRRELRRREVPDGIVDAALARLDDRDDLAVATDLALRRAQQLPGSLQPEAVARRLVGFLARRGYSEGLARRAAITASGLDREWD